jgi:hypothetical protein
MRPKMTNKLLRQAHSHCIDLERCDVGVNESDIWHKVLCNMGSIRKTLREKDSYRNGREREGNESKRLF